MRADTTATAVRAPTYVHRPTRVRAMQLTPDTYRDVLAWLEQEGASAWAAGEGAELEMWLSSAAVGQDSKIRLRTPQRARPVLMGDWIVHGVADVWYPVHDVVWRESYVAEEP